MLKLCTSRAIDRHAINDVASLLATVLVDRHLLVVVAEVIGHRVTLMLRVDALVLLPSVST